LLNKSPKNPFMKNSKNFIRKIPINIAIMYVAIYANMESALKAKRIYPKQNNNISFFICMPLNKFNYYNIKNIC
jgi:hypothetical protein